MLLINGCVIKSQAASQSKVVGTIFYVSTAGNDQWSGMLPDPSGNDGPFATLQHARDAIRRLRENDVNTGFTVLVRGGIYRINETFSLGPEDSGTKSHPTVFMAYNNERPVLSGTKLITNFTSYKNKIFKADLKESSLGAHKFSQLFANGKRQILARFPNYVPSDPLGSGFLYVKDQVEDGGKSKFKYEDGSVHDWGTLHSGNLFIYPGPNYWNDIISIAWIDYTNKIIYLASNTSYAIKSGNRYYFENLFEELDSPGEWYFDQREKELYFWPTDDLSLRNVNIPILKSIIEIRGNANGGAPAAYIRIEGFTIEGCEGTAVMINGANNMVARNIILNAGTHGVDVQGGTRNTVIGNDIYDVGCAGIVISGGDRKTMIPGENRAENNYIHHTGNINKYYSGIDCRGVGNIIAHNLVHSTPRIGISFDGNDHIIEYNHVHNVNCETKDSGIIYSCSRDWTKKGNIIRFNYFHNSGGYGRNSAAEVWRSPFYTWGIYLDDFTSGTTVYGNIIADTYYGGINVHGGKDNIIENNILVEGLTEQARFDAIPASNPMLPDMLRKLDKVHYQRYPQMSIIKDAEAGAVMSGNQFVRNIIYYTDKHSRLYTVSKTFDASQNVFAQNTIYHTGQPLIAPYSEIPPDQQWRTWKERGFDKNSITADPLFKDVAKGNFDLLPNSPAIKMGFKPIPFNKIGPYSDRLRASWPIDKYAH